MSANQNQTAQGYTPMRTAGFVLLACLAIVALSGWREWQSRTDALRNAEVDMMNLARSLTQHAEDTFEMADSILVGLVNRLEVDGTSPAAIAKLGAFLPIGKNNSRVRGIFIYGDAGQWLTTSERIDFKSFNNSDRDYFVSHRSSTDRGVLIGRPVKSRSGGQWIIPVSRRFNGPDGKFGGVALVTIDASYFVEFYKRFDIGENGAISLLTTDGIILARSNDSGSTGRDLSNSKLIRELDDRPGASVYYFKSPIDGVDRLSFYVRSDRYPMVILATKAQIDVLMPWRTDALVRMLIVLGLTGMIAAVGLYMVKQMRARQRMANVVRAKEADFRLLAEQSSDIVMRIALDGTIVYASPSAFNILGWDPARLTGTPALAGVNAQDLPMVQNTVSSLKAGEASEARISYRTRHRDRHEIWMETALRATRSPDTSAVDGVVAISRDVTEHKALENRLADLATKDGLTGLANRRHFDERLEAEWSRAMRDGLPLSLILIDVDNFKKFNDCYGHPAGDACLKRVAEILAQNGRRPADLVARYGGEEFVLLLPNTEANGCTLIGEAIRNGLRDVALLHALNLPSKRVTVSLGAATTRGMEKSGDSGSLVSAADRALYKAKESGRDRLVVSDPVACDAVVPQTSHPEDLPIG